MKIKLSTKYALSISEGNIKTGRIPSFSVTPVLSCASNVPCARLCYARRMESRRDNTKKAYRNNTDAIAFYDHDEIIKRITAYITLYDVKFFRFNVAGDFNLPGYFDLACKVARECPECQFLAFTKIYWLQEIKRSKNFNLVLSAWKDYRPENTVKAGIAYFDDGTPEANVPEHAIPCSGKCDNCLICFLLKKGEAVVFKKH